MSLSEFELRYIRTCRERDSLKNDVDRLTAEMSILQARSSRDADEAKAREDELSRKVKGLESALAECRQRMFVERSGGGAAADEVKRLNSYIERMERYGTNEDLFGEVVRLREALQSAKRVPKAPTREVRRLRILAAHAMAELFRAKGLRDIRFSAPWYKYQKIYETLKRQECRKKKNT